MMTALVDVEALIFRPESFVAQMPFAGKKCGVAVCLQRLGESEFLELQLPRVGRWQEARVPPPRLASGGTDIIGHARASGITAGHDARARGAAHGTRGVGVGEFHAGRRAPIAIRRVIKRTAKALEVRPAEVIDQKKNEVERLGFLIRLHQSRAQERQ